MSALPLTYFTTWLASGQRGLSSEAIVANLTGQQVGRWPGGKNNYPLDPDDFRRCQLLLRSHPEAAAAFGQMRSVSPEWERLVDAWDEIHATIEAETPDYLDNPGRRSAPLGYALMKRVLDGQP